MRTIVTANDRCVVGLAEGVCSKPGTVALCRSSVPSYAGIWIEDSFFTSYPSWNFTT